jgi:DNA-directed RNA polymerase subunit H (RpoH/RPB5)
MNPRYPIYIISKGRWESRLTSKVLEKMKVPYHIVIEPQEYEKYAHVIDPQKILILPFSNLGQGSIPARNWIWEYSINKEQRRHWIIDDNIYNFRRWNHNRKLIVNSDAIFKPMEDFIDRYKNIALAGPNYEMFVKQKYPDCPFRLNVRIYSCILINNELSYRWRGRYNEDTDLSLRVLKDGWCTVLFQAFLITKAVTMTLKGGNTDELYKQDDSFDGRLEMAKSLWMQHPDVVKITRKWGRWQHQVDYRLFKKNRLIKKEPEKQYEGINNYGMILTEKNQM